MNSRKALGTESEGTQAAPDVSVPRPRAPKPRPSTGPLKALMDLERMQFGELDRTTR
ncbi:hypothetical protein BH11MYX3_BH11MYX3_43820 [soil metagenome]